MTSAVVGAVGSKIGLNQALEYLLGRGQSVFETYIKISYFIKYYVQTYITYRYSPE